MTDDDDIAARIFLSYHKRNAALAKAIVESLRSEIGARWGERPRVSVWFDAAIAGGDNWDPQIQVELELSDIILFLITPACLEAGFMWTDEFPIALDRFRSGEGRVRLVPLLYSDTLAPIRTHRYTRGLNYIPDKPHDQMADGWTHAVTEGVCRLVEGVLRQRDPPMMKLKPALERAQNSLLGAQAMFGGASADGFFGPVLASEINNVLGAVEAALGLTARERLRALSVWEPKLKTALVRLKEALPDHARSLRDLRDAIDDVTTYSNEETTSPLPVHQSDPIRAGAHDAVRQVREEVGAARQVLADLELAPRAENPIERDARALTVDMGNRHATLAEALLDELQIDAAALSDEITGVDHVAQNFADTIGRLGDGASSAGQVHSANLSASAARAVRLTERLIAEGAAARTSSSQRSKGQEPASPLETSATPEAAPAPAAERPKPYKIPLELLESSPPRDAVADAATLRSQARMLEESLADLGVQGEVLSARPGPVVTLFEFEPASGVKSSRVIALSDDIARVMGAPAARAAVIPGRNTIGIELPGSVRHRFRLRDALSSVGLAGVQGDLPLALGETIEGESFAFDLTRMPHLLIAGTTGSGKSVGINAMILSMLYKHSPDECRFIMIDPKMLELSVYEGIPHLLHPVVTDPKKAVVALKWVVREMEDRYRRMSKLGVRNTTGYNERVSDALERGERLERTVHAGFDPTSDEPIYETRELPLEPMPYIVVVIDEMADLMITAGKEIEAAVQRLAQMARAAGIHVIMATQRPSVDVITGTIKANFPTRISYQVTSKIDSRTILGEQGAEQLLGQGDLLFMAGGGRIRRLHGALVSDLEVERVVEWLKDFGPPEYRADVTDPSDFGSDEAEVFGEDTNDLLERAIAIVRRDRKASTSHLQRRLQIGYNRAATLIEKMEKAGIISEASMAGKREVLPPDEKE